MTARVLRIVLACTLPLAGCSLFGSLDGFVGSDVVSPPEGGEDAPVLDGSATSEGSAADGEAGDGGAMPCKGDAGPAMVRVGSYCIDATEVTNKQYGTFSLAPLSPNAVAGCEWKGAFTSKSPQPSDFDLPVGNVDWCDAKAFCQWAGKRLCGRIGGGSVPDSVIFTTDPEVDEWFRVCSANGTRKYVYGQVYDETKCNSNTAGQKPVGSMPTCAAYDGGVFDLLGNTWEWVDSCSAVADGGAKEVSCQHRGGSNGFKDISCLDQLTQKRSFTAGDLGFRCCSD